MRSKLNVENIRQLRVGAWEDDKQYIVGDRVTYDITTSEHAVFICIRDHISLAGDNSEGEPGQPLQTAWTEKVIIGNVDPGTVS